MKIKSQSDKTCILYFTTGNREVKSFSSKKKKSDAVQRLLFTKTLAEIKKSKLEYRVSDGSQYSNDLLSGLTSAVKDVFATGFENVIIVGDDTPDLSFLQLRKAANNLNQQKISIGPAKDGGAYLIAFNRFDFEQGILKNLTWHSTQFKEELLQNINSLQLSYEELAELEDLDSAVDLHIFLKKNSYSTFFNILKNVIFSIQSGFRDVISYSSEYYIYTFNRGPPILF